MSIPKSMGATLAVACALEQSDQTIGAPHQDRHETGAAVRRTMNAASWDLAALKDFLQCFLVRIEIRGQAKHMRIAYSTLGIIAVPRQQDNGREAKLFRNNKSQAIRIPADHELPGDRVIIRRDGDRLIIEPVRKKNLLEVLTDLEPLGLED